MFWENSNSCSGVLLAIAGVLLGSNSYAQGALLNEVHTVANTTVSVPVEHSFSISVAGTYQVKLVDFGAAQTASAPLTSVKLGITSGSTPVPLTLASGSTTPGIVLSGAGTATFSAAVGTYIVHVVGAAGQTLGSGPIGIQISATSGNTLIASFSDTLAQSSNSALPPNSSTVDDSFTVPSAGAYLLTFSDLLLPAALPTLTMVITKDDGTVVTNALLTAAGSSTISLQSGVNYRIFAGGQADATVHAGLFGINVASAGGTSVYSKTIPVGSVSLIGSLSLTAGSHVLQLADLAFPSALSQLGAAATIHGQAAVQLSAAGSQAFTAESGRYEVFALATAADPSGSAGGSPAPTGTGSYALTLQPQGGSPVLSAARAVATAASGISAYSFDTAVTAAGSYPFEVADFGFPNQLSSLKAAAVQGGALLGTGLQTAGTTTISAAAGPLSLLVFTQALPTGGLFGLDVGGSTSPLFAATQAVGQVFASRQLSITNAARYGVTLSDVGFPAPFGRFAAIVTRGITKAGEIFGGGTTYFDATAQGNYLINFIAEPSTTEAAGTYAMTVALAPVVKLESDVTTVTSGGTVHLKWSSQNAAKCVASDGWSGDQELNGSTTSLALTTDTTFKLACSGEGGTTSATLTVSVQAPAPSKSGGGALTTDLILLLGAGVLARASSRRHCEGGRQC